ERRPPAARRGGRVGGATAPGQHDSRSHAICHCAGPNGNRLVGNRGNCGRKRRPSVKQQGAFADDACCWARACDLVQESLLVDGNIAKVTCQGKSRTNTSEFNQRAFTTYATELETNVDGTRRLER